ADLYLFEDFLKADEREEGFRPVRLFLDDHISTLKNLSEVTLKGSLPKLKQWTDPGISSFLNNLPYDFDSVKIELLVYLVGATVKIQHTNRKLCKALSKQMVKVMDLPMELSDTIDNNDRIYQGNIRAIKSNSGSGSYWWMIWVVLILMRILLKC
ncbi:MAG: hypothetical protein ABIT58_08500, partial [Ferruginibacter sp.]